MSQNIDTAARPRFTAGGSERVDRILIAVSIALWLTALGAGVAAVVSLVGLANGQSSTSGDADTPWLLYSVIGVSAVVIIAAIPLLIRARQAAREPAFAAPTPAGRPGDARAGALAPPAQQLEPLGAPVLRRSSVPAAVSRVGFPTGAVDQVWLRCPVIIAGAMGAAMTAIGAATYLLASENDTAAWALLGVAGVITVLTPVVPWFFLRQLRAVLDDSVPAAT